MELQIDGIRSSELLEPRSFNNSACGQVADGFSTFTVGLSLSLLSLLGPFPRNLQEERRRPFRDTGGSHRAAAMNYAIFSLMLDPTGIWMTYFKPLADRPPVI